MLLQTDIFSNYSSSSQDLANKCTYASYIDHSIHLQDVALFSASLSYVMLFYSIHSLLLLSLKLVIAIQYLLITFYNAVRAANSLKRPPSLLSILFKSLRSQSMESNHPVESTQNILLDSCTLAMYWKTIKRHNDASTTTPPSAQ